MPVRDTRLLDEAFDMLREADRLHRQFMTLALGRSGPCWEPPIDIVENASETGRARQAEVGAGNRFAGADRLAGARAPRGLGIKE